MVPNPEEQPRHGGSNEAGSAQRSAAPRSAKDQLRDAAARTGAGGTPANHAQGAPAAQQDPATGAQPVTQKPEAPAKARRAPVASNAAAHAMRLLARARGAEAAQTTAPGPSGPLAVVIGGGIAGLVAARELAATGHRVEVHEASGAFGGCVGVHEVAGLTLDAGAESFATRSSAVPELIADLGLGDDIVTPTPGGAWLYLKRGGENLAQPLPSTGILGIPGDPWADEVRSAIGRAGALRAAADLITPVSKKLLESEMSLGALVRSRMGTAVLENLVTPVVSGVYSADPDTLDVDAIAPGLRASVLKHGSLARAVASMRAAAPAGSAVGSITGGMNRLVGALLEDLRAAGVQLHTNSAVATLAPGAEASGFRVGLASEPPVPAPAKNKKDGPAPELDTVKDPGGAGTRQIEADRVVIATGGRPAVDLLAGIDAGFSQYMPAQGAGISLVTLVIDKPELDDAPRGTGLLVAPTVTGVGAKALTHGTAKWQWLGDESGPGSHVVRLSYGRLNDVAASLANADDATLRDAALADASVLLGIEIDAGDVLGFDVVRYAGALPFATAGHTVRVAGIRKLVATHPGLEVIGAWLAGTGLAAVIADTTKRLRVTAS